MSNPYDTERLRAYESHMRTDLFERIGKMINH
jgi:hypothetical protein